MRAAALRCLARHERMGEHYVSVIATQLLDGSPLVRAAAVTGLGSLGAAGRGYQDEAPEKQYRNHIEIRYISSSLDLK